MEAHALRVKSLQELLETDELTPEEREEYSRLIVESQLLRQQWRDARLVWARRLPEEPKRAAKDTVADLRVLRR